MLEIPQSIAKKKLALIGTGNMGRAILDGLSGAGFPMDQVMATRRRADKLPELERQHGVLTTSDVIEAHEFADIVLLCVKPQVLGAVVSRLSGENGKIYISVAAGISLELLKEMLGADSITRAMPNLAVGVREGMTCAKFSVGTTSEERIAVQELFEALGAFLEVDEDLMDAVTGLSGTGPMYIFLVIEALSDAGVKVGLSRSDSNILASQTVVGAAKMVIDSREHPIILKDRVTSPGGTAINALHVLERSGFRAIFMDAVEAATQRAVELGRRRDP